MFEVILPVIAALFINSSFVSPIDAFDSPFFTREDQQWRISVHPTSTPSLESPTQTPVLVSPTNEPTKTPEPTPTDIQPTFYPTGIPEPEPSMPYPIDPPPCPWKYDPATMKRPIIDGEELIMPCVHL